jgi:hypothetical protein
MAFISSADAFTTCNANNPINNGSLVVMNPKGGSPPGSGGIYQARIDVNHTMDSGVFVTRASRRFFPQWLLVTSGSYNYSNGG